jgi:hypothetical protein
MAIQPFSEHGGDPFARTPITEWIRYRAHCLVPRRITPIPRPARPLEP